MADSRPPADEPRQPPQPAYDEPARGEPAHDILAAEEFAVPAPDAALHEQAERAAEEAARDVLAAEEFAVPAPDPVLHVLHSPARDVLAAEEFALPAGPEAEPGPGTELVLVSADGTGADAGGGGRGSLRQRAMAVTGAKLLTIAGVFAVLGAWVVGRLMRRQL